ncbi:tumor necrosis factor ligand superfamily member 9 [Cavia porcellus]|uniref:tumor necrosis factor ligand superfamily member 9 n=1 Tax=Cavia porcellus TaxID=10141 RepID=UPI000661DF0E|nr:tumor necrosis factor ligand superfamily member 9 [Cavia porcellus]
MSSRPDVAADPEAAWPPAPRSGPRRLPCGVPGTPAALLATLVLGAAVGGLLTWALLARPGLGGAGGPPSTRTGSSEEPPEPGLTARLLAQNAILKNGTLSWHSEHGMAGVHLSPGVTYDEPRRELVVAKAGFYKVCLHLQLTHVLPAARISGKVSMALHLEPPQTGASVQAPAVDLTPQSSVSAQASHCHLLQVPKDQRLSVHLGVYLSAQWGEHQVWQLAQSPPATKLELFRVAAEVPD